LEKELGVPGSDQTPSLDASLGFMSADEVEGEAADDGHVTVIS
jgi:hypothetical protein